MTHRRTSYDEEDTFEIIETLGHSAAKQDFHCGQEFREVTSEWTVEIQTKVREVLQSHEAIRIYSVIFIMRPRVRACKLGIFWSFSLVFVLIP